MELFHEVELSRNPFPASMDEEWSAQAFECANHRTIECRYLSFCLNKYRLQTSCSFLIHVLFLE